MLQVIISCFGLSVDAVARASCCSLSSIMSVVQAQSIEPEIVFTSSDDSDDEHIPVAPLLVGNMSVYHEQLRETQQGRPHGRVESRKDDPLYKIEVSCSKCIINCVVQEEKFVADRTMKFTQGAFEDAVKVLDLRHHFKDHLRENTDLHSLDLSSWNPSESYLFSSLLAIHGCLRNLGVQAVPLSFKRNPLFPIPQVVQQATTNPESQLGYLCCLDENWLVLRKIGNQWVRLDPRMAGPQLLNDLYLGLFVSQFLEEDRMIFVLEGLKEIRTDANQAAASTEEGAAAAHAEILTQHLGELGLVENADDPLQREILMQEQQAVADSLRSVLSDVAEPALVEANKPKKIDDETLCCVCLECATTHIVIPCGHFCLCADCVETYRNKFSLICPLCKAQANEIIKVYR